jgi:hypothetical protein
VSSIGVSQVDPKAQATVLDSYGKLPLSFEANLGQADGQVKFLSRTGGYTLFLTGDEAVLALRGSAAKKPAPKGVSGFGGATVSLKRYPDTNPDPNANPNTDSNRNPATPQSTTGGVLRMKLRNANPAATVTGMDELAGRSNYFIGNDPAKWRTNVPTYGKVKYAGIYSGIDLVYYGNQRQLEYDFIVAPGADPRRIEFDIGGAKQIRRDGHGDLLFKMGDGEIRWHKPVAYQERDGARQLVAARYAITNRNRVGFEVAEYDASRPLYIDPLNDTLIYSTYLGGNLDDTGYGIAVDSAGDAYVTGLTYSTNFPTMDPLQPANDGGGDAFVSKINPSGSALVYSTYLGGSGYDLGYGIAVDSAGDAYVTGLTYSSNFPTMNPLQPAFGGGNYDAFVAKLNPSGSALVYSTYLGGSGDDFARGIAVDSAGNAYLDGRTTSTNFPTMNPLQATNGGSADAFVAKLNPAGSALVYSTYLGGSGYENDQGHGGIAVDSAGSVYVTGDTDSSNFPTTPGVILRTCPHGCQYSEPYVTKLNPTGSALVYSTYLPGQIYDFGAGIAVDSAGDAYVVGTTIYPSYDAFLYKLNPTGSALVGGHSGYNDSTGDGVAVDSSGSAYVTGRKHFQAYIVKFGPGSAGPAFSVVYLHGNVQEEGIGIAVDNSNHAFVTGYTASTNFPTKNPLQPIFGGGYRDAFVAKIDMRGVTATTIWSSPNPSIYGQAVTFTGKVWSYVGAPVDGETITFVKGTKVLGTGTLSGSLASFTTSSLLPVGTNYVRAVYGGDSTLLGSTSKPVDQVVNKAATTTTLTSSQNPSNVGQSVTFTASVTPQFSGTVKGNVTFYDGATALQTVALSGGVAKFTTSALTSGSHPITATYNGSSSFTGSSASLTQTVN